MSSLFLRLFSTSELITSKDKRKKYPRGKLPNSLIFVDPPLTAYGCGASIDRVATKLEGDIPRMLCAPLDWQYAELPSSASDAVLCYVLVRKMWDI